MFGMPAVNAAALADAQKKPGDSEKAEASEADVKKTMLGMPAASAEKEEKAAADSVGKKEEKPAGEKAPAEKKSRPEKKKEPETAIQKQEEEMPAEGSAKKGIIIGAVIGVIILIILAIILFSGD